MLMVGQGEDPLPQKIVAVAAVEPEVQESS